MSKKRGRENGYALLHSTCSYKEGRPFTNYVWMCDLQTRRRELTLSRPTATMIKLGIFFVGYIAAVGTRHIHDHFSSTSFLSLLSDGSTESAVVVEEIVFFKVCKGRKGLCAMFKVLTST